MRQWIELPFLLPITVFLYFLYTNRYWLTGDVGMMHDFYHGCPYLFLPFGKFLPGEIMPECIEWFGIFEHGMYYSVGAEITSVTSFRTNSFMLFGGKCCLRE